MARKQQKAPRQVRITRVAAIALDQHLTTVNERNARANDLRVHPRHFVSAAILEKIEAEQKG